MRSQAFEKACAKLSVLFSAKSREVFVNQYDDTLAKFMQTEYNILIRRLLKRLARNRYERD